MFYVSYVASELRRRLGRTLLTALGLGVGVGLVVAVAALSDGLDRAQDEVLRPLTGVGTDMSVSRPLNPEDGAGGGGPFGNLSAEERERLRRENGGARLDLSEAGEPGERFSRTSFMTTQLSFPSSTVGELRALDGVAQAAGSLTLNAVTVSGTVPEGGFGPGPAGAQRGPAPSGGGDRVTRNIDLETMTVTGVDVGRPELATIGPDDVTDGRYLQGGSAREAVLNVAYAERRDLAVGDEVTLDGRSFEVVGIARAPLGGSAPDVLVELGRLQRIAGREDRVNGVQVRAEDADAVPAVERAIGRTLEGASVTTSAELAERIGGSLTDAKALSDKLGVALTAVALVAAFLIASLLTLSSVAKRVRELGTLKALGWPQRKVVRQVTGESLAQGALGGVLGALLGIGAAAAINAIGITLDATVAAQAAGGGGAPGPGPGGGPGGGGPVVVAGPGGGFGQGAVQTGSTSVALEAPVDLGLVLLAISLALLGGLVAGSVGGLRAARLRPADALRHIG